MCCSVCRKQQEKEREQQMAEKQRQEEKERRRKEMEDRLQMVMCAHVDVPNKENVYVRQR